MALKDRNRPLPPAGTTRSKTLLKGRDRAEPAETGVPSNTASEVERQILFGDQRMWSVVGDNYFPCDKTEDQLPAGQYIPMFNEHRGIYFVNKAVNLDELLVLPDSETTYVLDAISDFWKREKAFRKHGFLWKRGMLLWGPPGSGKTSCLQQLSKQIIDKGGLSIYCTSPVITAEALRIMRRIEPKRPAVVMIEDIDAVINRHGEPDLLALLDGELQIDNVVYIATTNYPEELDPRFIQRPSRFDEVIYIGMPSTAAREMYLKSKNPRLQKDAPALAEWVELTEGFSIAALKEVIVAVECLGRDLKETIKIEEIMERKPTSTDHKKSNIGFAP